METAQVNKEEITNINTHKMFEDNNLWTTLLLYFLFSGNNCNSCPLQAMQGYIQPPIYININSNNVNDKKENSVNA